MLARSTLKKGALRRVHLADPPGRTTRSRFGTLSTDVHTRAWLTPLLLLAAPALAQMSPPRPFQTPEVTLLEAGSEPKTKFRYDYQGTDGGTGAYDIAAGGWWQIDAAGSKATRVFPILQTPVKTLATPTGFFVAFEKPKAVEVADGGFVDPSMEQVLAALDGVHGLVPVDTRGAPLSVGLLPGAADTKYAATRDQLELRSAMAIEVGKQMLGRLVVPFPVEAVGKHAKWRVKRFVIRGQVQYDEHAYFELLEVKGSLVTLAAHFSGEVDPVGPYHPGELVLMVKGQGKATLDLRRPLPVSWDDEIDIDATMLAPNGLKAIHKGHLTTQVRLR